MTSSSPAASLPRALSALTQAMDEDPPPSDQAFQQLISDFLLRPNRSPSDLGPVLVHAITRFNLSATSALLAAGAPVEGVPTFPTPLALATHFQRHDIVEALLLAGANANSPSYNGHHPCLRSALFQRDENIALALIRHGANTQSAPKNRLSDLLVACRNDMESSVAALLIHGADPLAQTQTGLTPAQWARDNDHAACADILDAFIEARDLANAAPSPAATRPGSPKLSRGAL